MFVTEKTILHAVMVDTVRIVLDLGLDLVKDLVTDVGGRKCDSGSGLFLLFFYAFLPSLNLLQSFLLVSFAIRRFYLCKMVKYISALI